MPTIYILKGRFQDLLRPLVRKFASCGISANQITIAAILLSFFYSALMVMFAQERWPWLSLPALFFVRMALNAIDGMLAREFGQKSRLGAILNELGDVLSDAALFLPFVLLFPDALWPIILFCILAIISEMTGVVAVQIGAQRRYDGPMGKTDRVAALGTIAFFTALGIPLLSFAIWIFGILDILLFMTIYNRARRALGEAAS